MTATEQNKPDPSTKRRRPLPEDDSRPVFISPEARHQYYEDLKRETKWQAVRRRVRAIFSASTVALLTTAVIAETAAISIMLPLKEIVPLIVYQKDDGTVTNYMSWSELPPMVRNDTTVNVVWQYVQYWESWSKGNAPLAYDVVSALSAPNVRDQWQDYYDPKNPLSPQNVYGETTVQVKWVNFMPVCPENGCVGDPQAYRFWFDRIETPPGEQPGKPVRYAVTVRILRNVPLPPGREAWRWTFNAPLVQVVEYPGATRDGIAR